jgi:glycosyltransferase involved in cell wall biosynthesis
MDTSIIIPSRNAAKLLDNTLAALGRQETTRSFEVIVVDDESVDDTRTVCAKYNVNYVLMPRMENDKLRKAAEARNLGAAHAKGELLIFLDADMVPGPVFVERHCAAGKERTIVLGIRHDTLPDGEIVERDAREPYFFVCGDDLSKLSTPWSLLYSHNFSVARKDFARVDGFSTCYPVWGAEDQDLGYKLWKNGSAFVFDRRIVAVHQYHPPEYRNEFEKKVNLIANATRFYERYYDDAIARVYSLDKRLIVLRLDVGCNNNCMQCIQAEGIVYPGSAATLAQDIAVVPRDWKIIISGMEPTLSRELFALVAVLDGHTLELETNGRALSYRSFCSDCIRHGIHDFLVHVFGDTRDLHDRATRVPGSFDQTLRGIGNLRKLGQGVGVRICITDENAPLVMSMVSHYRKMGLPLQLALTSRDHNALVPVIRNRKALISMGVTFIDPFMKCILEGNRPPLDVRGCSHCSLLERCRGRVEDLVHAYA